MLQVIDLMTEYPDNSLVISIHHLKNDDQMQVQLEGIKRLHVLIHQDDQGGTYFYDKPAKYNHTIRKNKHRIGRNALRRSAK